MAMISLHSKREYAHSEYLNVKAHTLAEGSDEHIINLYIDGAEVTLHLDLEAVELLHNTLATYLSGLVYPLMKRA